MDRIAAAIELANMLKAIELEIALGDLDRARKDLAYLYRCGKL